MSAYMKGPWVVYPGRRYGDHPGVDASGSFSVIVFGLPSEDTGVHGSSPENALANAHLIAAAPEMYEACQAAKILLAALTRPTDPDASLILEMIDDALAKARGES